MRISPRFRAIRGTHAALSSPNGIFFSDPLLHPFFARRKSAARARHRISLPDRGNFRRRYQEPDRNRRPVVTLDLTIEHRPVHELDRPSEHQEIRRSLGIILYPKGADPPDRIRQIKHQRDIFIVNQDFGGRRCVLIQPLDDRAVGIRLVAQNRICQKLQFGSDYRCMTQCGRAQQTHRQTPPGGEANITAPAQVAAGDQRFPRRTRTQAASREPTGATIME